METTQIIATREWRQLTDGTKDIFIQFYGGVDLCRSATQPDADAPFLRFCDTTITITAPDITWIRTYWQSGGVIVTIW
ncbi:TPA: hypothetical protein I8P13_002382 [Salmonella enterica subsp. enterica serovar Napoli]|nr:hypothetical protein [Salmonella enterica subsp. enterica serovar Napoli]HBC0226533.1 hypothetical protein [Salmonella enterica subsp. enterica serovar Napoli]HBC0253463.1 hypothetical protein [Salmonella enterica subsp. enterica serovar Napoli]HBC0274083.1 hypothetical protein [Salmonella enterica subsp. enterica serovar Napoli]HBZ8589804.1 hypothetical protein [Salmonella enterica subsp. enterica]